MNSGTLVAVIVAAVFTALAVTFVILVREEFQQRGQQAATRAKELREDGCVRTGYVSESRNIRAVYTCPNGEVFLGEYR